MMYRIEFAGHENIRSNHEMTIEITRGRDLTPSGDCIVGVGAAVGCAGLPDPLKDALRTPGSQVTCTIEAGGYEFVVRGEGDAGLALEDAEDMVLRKSGHVCPRTLAVKCDKASDMMPREMVRALRDPDTRGVMTISVD